MIVSEYAGRLIDRSNWWLKW